MKKSIGFLFVAVLMLNLLPQNICAFNLSSDELRVFYENEADLNNWKNFFLPHAKYAKIIHPSATDLYVAKIAKDNETIIDEIEKATLHQRQKMFVQWERDNQYLSEEEEKSRQITPLLRHQLLQEIKEEEEREKGKKYDFAFKVSKAIVSSASAIATFTVAKYKGTDIREASKLTALIFASVTASISVLEVIGKLAWNKINRLWKGEDEIKLPPLQDLPVIPKGHKKIDIYSL
jgi:hypothetical protein